MQEADGAAYLVRSTDQKGIAVSALTADYLSTRQARPRRKVPACLLPLQLPQLPLTLAKRAECLSSDAL